MIRWASAQSLSTRGFRLFSNSLSSLESPHLPRVKLENGRFISPWPNSSGMNGTYVYNSLFKRGKSYKLSSPKYAFNHEAIRLHRHLDLINEFLHLQTMKFMWLGHSTCYVQMGGAFILTDPVWCQRVSPFRSLGPARLMQVSLSYLTLYSALISSPLNFRCLWRLRSCLE